MRAREMMHKELAQSVLLYESKSCVVTGETLEALEGFHHQADINITGMTAKYVADREWEYPPVVVVL